MKNRALVIVLMALAIAAVIFIAKRPPGQRADSLETVSNDNGPSPQPTERAAGNAAAQPGFTIVSPTVKTPVASQTLKRPAQQNPIPYPVGQPVVVGSRTFVPKMPPPPPDEQAGGELDKVRSMLRDYRTLYHENPVGTNAEIMKAVMGGNPKQARLGPPEGQTLNASEELVDRWETPYFFHQLSGDLMEIRSAGPDKILWTSDDLVTK